MQKPLKVKDLPKATQERFEKVTMTGLESLTIEDVEFLRARADYLRPEQKEFYESVLVKKATKKK